MAEVRTQVTAIRIERTDLTALVTEQDEFLAEARAGQRFTGDELSAAGDGEPPARKWRQVDPLHP